MLNNNSDDYHDYVIKNGVLIGQFEKMYKKSREVPWHQDKQEDWLDVRLSIELLREYAPFSYLCDLGCGLGYFLNILNKNIGTRESRVIGYDISRTCCEKARKLFPGFAFYEIDLMSEHEQFMEKIIVENKENRRLFVLRGTLWYVFPKIRNVVRNIADIVTGQSLLFISQNFPPLKSHFVGKEVIPNPDALIKWFEEYFTVFKTICFKDIGSQGNDNWFMGIFARKA